MTFSQFSARMERAKALGSRPGLTRIRTLLSALGLPDEKLHILHVTGTNGKGSTCAAAAAGLVACGYRVGRFSSPEIFSPLERILVDEIPVTPEEICLAAKEVFPAADRMADPPTEYELYMALCLAHFRNRGVTHGVIEACMGGAGDVTHVFPRTDICAFTPVSLDHTRFLGETVEQIAKEKSGILTPGCTAVCGPEPPEVRKVLQRACEEAGAELVQTDGTRLRVLSADADLTRISYKGYEGAIAMGGDFQTQNLALAMEILMQWAKRIPIDLCRAFEGIRRVRLPGRFDRVAEDPDTYFDAGHNPSGIAALCDTLDRLFPERPLVCVMAMYADKDYKTCIRRMAERSLVFFAAQSDSPRALSAEKAAETARSVCGDVRLCPDPAEALALARRVCPKDGTVIFCGSFGHLAKGYMKLKEEERP